MNSKTKLIAGGLLAIVVIIGAVSLRSYLQDRTIPTVVDETIDRPALNFAFTFPGGEAAYSYVEPSVGQYGSTTGLEAAFILIKTDAYIAFQQTPGGETPPSLSLFVFGEPDDTPPTNATGTPRLDRMTRLRNWAAAHDTLTMFTRAKATPEEVFVDGVTLLRYQTDGLYEQEVYVGFHKSRYYLFVGQFDGQGDPERATFERIISSISFN